MMGVDINVPVAPEPTKTCLSKEAADECVATINVITIISHPTANDQKNVSNAKKWLPTHVSPH